MASREQSVQFSVNWKINWSEFAKLSSSYYIEKMFVTSYNNVPLCWRAELFVPSGVSSDIGYRLHYSIGPIEKFKNMEHAISIMKPDSSIATTDKSGGYEARRGYGYGWKEYFDKDPVAFRAECGLKESDPLFISITLKIPISVFSYAPTAPPPTVPPKWQTDLLQEIQDPEKSIFWGAKLISRDGAEFYCHKVIAFQSEPLRAMFHHPPPDGKPENEYPFPRLGSASLKSLIRYLYTGQSELVDLTTKDLIELADATEMFNLKPLKAACAVVLWQEVTNPESCSEILRFAVLHDDLKDLKYRAMDVVAEYYEKLLAVIDDDEDEIDFFGDNRLRKEFLLFLSRRVEPNFAG